MRKFLTTRTLSLPAQKLFVTSTNKSWKTLKTKSWCRDSPKKSGKRNRSKRLMSTSFRSESAPR